MTNIKNKPTLYKHQNVLDQQLPFLHSNLATDCVTDIKYYTFRKTSLYTTYGSTSYFILLVDIYLSIITKYRMH